jgi:hypothetical protein
MPVGGSGQNKPLTRLVGVRPLTMSNLRNFALLHDRASQVLDSPCCSLAFGRRPDGLHRNTPRAFVRVLTGKMRSKLNGCAYPCDIWACIALFKV